MRRFIAFIVLTFSMLALVFFNIQGQVESLNWSQEFDKGTEVVYNINVPDEQDGVVDIDHVIEVMGNRLEEAGATNYKLESSVNSADKNYEVRIILGSRNSSDVDNILRSTMAAGDFSIFTTDGTNAALNAIERGSAEVFYNENHEAYIRVETTEEVDTVAKKAKEEGNSLLVLWQNKTDDFDYTNLAESDYICPANNLTADQLKERVLAVIDIGDTAAEEETQEQTIDNSKFEYNEEDDKYYLTFKAFGYNKDAESTRALNANSAHSFERILNSELLNYDITEVYRTSASAEYGENATTFVVWGAAAVVIIIFAYLLFTYGLSAISGCVGIALTIYLDLLLLNFFNLTATPVVILSLIVTIAMGVNLLNVYYKRTKEEAYRGRSLSKASNEGFRKTISTALDSTIVMFALGIILALISREIIKTFSIFFVFSSILSFLLIFLLTKFLNNFIYNSNVASNPKLFRLKKENISDLDGKKEEEIEETKIEQINVKKHAKKVSIGTLVGVAVAALSIAGFGIFSSAFNYSNQAEYGRIEIRSAETKIFETVEDSGVTLDNSKVALDNLVYYLENVNKDDNVKATNYWAITDQKNPYDNEKNYVYFYVDLEKPLSTDSATFTALDNYVNSIDDDVNTTIVNSYVVNAGVVTSDFANTLILMGVTVGITLLYFFIRYRYTFGLSSFVNLSAGTFIAVGLLSLTRLATSAYVGVGIFSGLLLNMLFLMPLGNRIGQLKNESKVRVTTYEQREEIAYGALKSTITQYFVSIVGFVVLFLVLTAISPIDMYAIYISTMISLLVNGFLGLFAIIPLHLWFEKKFKFSRLKSKRAQALKAKRERIAKANRNKGAEPEEIIIPGIND